MRPKLSPKELRQWLEGKEPTTVVGLTYVNTQCPLANYLKDKYQASYASVDARTYCVNGMADDSWHDLPKWAQRLVRSIDSLNARRIHTPVQANEALSLLEGALRERS